MSLSEGQPTVLKRSPASISKTRASLTLGCSATQGRVRQREHYGRWLSSDRPTIAAVGLMRLPRWRRGCSQELRAMRPLALKPSLGSSQFTEAPCKHTMRIAFFRPNRQCTRVAKSRSGSVAVRTRTMEKQQVAHGRLSKMSHDRRERMNTS